MEDMEVNLCDELWMSMDIDSDGKDYSLSVYTREGVIHFPISKQLYALLRKELSEEAAGDEWRD
ncbi:hypothetical protein [Geomicrobium sp. JCM 19039]|uniref:hypothetical protein n=1 Tax=Geomicrobium sp. JCM 19039 TaxID=1460636 RepID=UPI00045F421D|nr:hypothetical protein [Geomicrobium sp. JCM 19039]GAK12220.1 hypothetical protein JCM19039_1970 [Geomicrobium sp. JCM 19039]